MKRFLIFGLLAILLLAVLAFDKTSDVSAFAPATPTRAPRNKQSQPIPTVQPDAEELDESAAEISPVAPGPMTSQIVLFNPDTSGTAIVQVEIYDASGAVAFTSTVNVAANGAKLVTLPNSLGSNFQGGAVISSDKNVQAIVVGANATNTARDSYEGSIAPAINVALPFVRHLAASTQNSILAIQNTTATAANLTVTLYNLDGTVAKQQNANVAAHQSLYLNTNALFPSSIFVGSARVVSDQNVVVAAQTRYYKDSAAFSGIRTGDTSAILYLSQADRKLNVSNLPVAWSEIFVRNNGTNATNVTLEFYLSTGTLVTSSGPTVVQPNGTAQFLLNDAAFVALGSKFSGWAKITSSGEPISATALSLLSKGKRMYAVNALTNVQVSSRYVCGDTSRMATQNSRLTILNTDPAKTATVIVRLFDKDSGAKLVQAKIKVLPNSLGTVSLGDTAFAAVGTNYQGMAVLQAKGTTPPKILVTVTNPYANPKLSGTTGYACSPA